ncbi:hypothetical protein T484DRAFT_3335550, partial [Baffinella frigidus]
MQRTCEVKTDYILVMKTKPDLKTKEGKSMYNRASYLKRKLQREIVAKNDTGKDASTIVCLVASDENARSMGTDEEDDHRIEQTSLRTDDPIAGLMMCSSEQGSLDCPKLDLSTSEGRSEYNKTHYQKRKVAGLLNGATKRQYNRTFFPKRQPGNQGFRNPSCDQKSRKVPIAAFENTDTEDADQETLSEEMTEDTPMDAFRNTEDADQETLSEEMTEDTPMDAFKNTEDADQETLSEEMTEDTPMDAFRNTEDSDQNTL